MIKYTVKRDDQILGEFSEEQIKQYKGAGELLSSDLVNKTAKAMSGKPSRRLPRPKHR